MILKLDQTNKIKLSDIPQLAKALQARILCICSFPQCPKGNSELSLSPLSYQQLTISMVNEEMDQNRKISTEHWGNKFPALHHGVGHKFAPSNIINQSGACHTSYIGYNIKRSQNSCETWLFYTQRLQHSSGFCNRVSIFGQIKFNWLSFDIQCNLEKPEVILFSHFSLLSKIQCPLTSNEEIFDITDVS